MKKHRITLDADAVLALVNAMGRAIDYDDKFIGDQLASESSVEVLAAYFAVRAKHITLKSRLEKLIEPPKKRRK